MEKIFLLFLVILPFAAISQTQGVTDTPYVAAYSSKFKMAEKSYAGEILALFKDYENNTIDKHADMIADTVTMVMANGTVIKGRANNLASIKKYRSSIKNLKFTLEAWMSLRSVDRDQIWVAIWATEDFTDKDGKQVTINLHEIWGFNGDGDVSIMRQYAEL
jgi:hypothetical protein